MRVWVLEWYCDDSASYDLVDLFEDFEGVIKYLKKEIPDTDFILETQDEEIKIWKADYFVPKEKRTHYSMDRSDYVVSRKKVK